MSGVFGLDMQRTRSTIALVEGGGRAAGARSVGDGRRQVVPNAFGPGALWGSRSADAVLGGLAAADLAEHLFDWCREPFEPPFLRGVYDRLFAYLGHTAPTTRHGYHVCVAAGPATEGPVEDGAPGPDVDTVIRRCASAGLAGVSVVRPTDALLYRWLAEAAPERHTGTVLAVACGEEWTAATAYRVDAGEHVDTLGAGWRPVGSRPAAAQLARLVLDRCREGVSAASLLALLDGVLEFGAVLLAEPAGRDVEWDGPLTDRMFAPLRLSRGRMAGWPEITAATDAAADLAGVLLSPSHGRRPTVLVGGLGAVWPFVADRLHEAGTVWQSENPAHDLSIGAAWSPRVRAQLTGAPVPAGARAVGARAVDAPPAGLGEIAMPAPEPADVGPIDADPADVDLAEIPPWLRDA